MPDAIPLPLLFALSSLVLQGLFELVYQVAHRGSMDESTYMVVQTGTVFTTLTAVSGGALGFALTPQLALLGVVSGLLGITTGFTHLYAMGRGPGSVTSAVRRLGFVVTALMAVAFLGEKLTLEKTLAMLVAAGALMVMSLRTDAASKPHPAIYVALLTSGMMVFLHKVAAMQQVSASAFLMTQSATAHVSSHVMCLRRGGYRFDGTMVRYALLTGAMAAAAMLFGIYALRAGEAVVIAPILQLGFLVTAPLSFVFMREPVTGRKLLGMGLGAAAILSFAQQIG